MLTSIRNVKFSIKMRWNILFITAVGIIFFIKVKRLWYLVKLRWPKNKNNTQAAVILINITIIRVVGKQKENYII